MNEYDWESLPLDELAMLDGLDLMQEMLSQDESWARHVFRNHHPEEWD